VTTTKLQSVECGQHGHQDETFVCQHIVQGLRDQVPYGFWWASDPGNPRPGAWCTACNEVVAATGGEWTEDAERFAGVQLLCGRCYDLAKAMNLGRATG
jgi:hypothetical protein